MLEVGTKAPDFELPDQNGQLHKLSDYLGKKIVLYFYPRDNTPGAPHERLTDLAVVPREKPHTGAAARE